MKAVIYTRYGSPDVLQMREVEKPNPQADEILVEIYAAAANAADWHFLRGTPFFLRFFSGLFKPNHQILGADIAGLVAAVGQNVTRFKSGDAVFGDLSGHGFGGFAEYATVPESQLVLKPAQLSFEETAAVPMAAVTALQALRDVGQIHSGQQVLINGASGGVGTFAVQIAKAFGAEVTAVCSTSKIELARSLGADHLIDYTKEDFTQNGQRYDLILSANGSRPLSDYEQSLKPTGTYVMVGGSMTQMFQAILLGPLKSKTGGKTLRDFTAAPNQKDLAFVAELIEAGQIKPVIDRCYPLAEVPKAIRYLEKGHARGKVIIKVK